MTDDRDATIATLRAERDAAIVKAASANRVYVNTDDSLRVALERVTAERDAAVARAEVRGAGCQCSDAEACAFVRDRDRLRAALTELVACKDLKDRVEVLNHDRERGAEWKEAFNEYARRKPLAWAAARAAIDAAPSATAPLPPKIAGCPDPSP